MAIFYVYLDSKPCGTTFYVGKGNANRVSSKERNKWHAAICKKHPNWTRVVVFEGTEEECHAEEIRLISLHGRRDQKLGTLVNLTNGGEGATGVVRDEITLAKMSVAQKIAQAKPELKAAFSARVKAMWADPELRAKIVAARSTPEAKLVMSVSNKAAQSTPEAKAAQSERMKTKWSDPVFKAKRSAAVKAACSTDVARDRLSQAGRQMWSDPAFREKQLMLMASGFGTVGGKEGVGQRLSEASKARWSDPEHRSNVSSAIKSKWADPAFREKIIASRSTPEIKAKRSEALKAAHARRRNAKTLDNNDVDQAES